MSFCTYFLSLCTNKLLLAILPMDLGLREGKLKSVRNGESFILIFQYPDS